MSELEGGHAGTPSVEELRGATASISPNDRGVEHVVADEVLREQIRRLVPSVRNQSNWVVVLAHPLAGILFAFLLSGVLGWGLTTWYADRQREIAARSAQNEASRRAIQEIARVIYRRYACAVMLRSALNRGASVDELRGHKRAYDDATVEWIVNLDATLREMRELSGEASYRKLRAKIETELVPTLNAIDECLTNVYDSKIEHGSASDDAVKQLQLCRSDENLTVVLSTNSEIVDELSLASAKRLTH